MPLTSSGPQGRSRAGRHPSGVQLPAFELAARAAIWWEGLTAGELIVLWPNTSMHFPERFVEEDLLSSPMVREDPARWPFPRTRCRDEKGAWASAGRADVSEQRTGKRNNCLQAKTMDLLYEILIFRADQCPVGRDGKP